MKNRKFEKSGECEGEQKKRWRGRQVAREGLEEVMEGGREGEADRGRKKDLEGKEKKRGMT